MRGNANPYRQMPPIRVLYYRCRLKEALSVQAYGREAEDGVAQDDEFAVKEMRGTGDGNDGQILRFRPFQCFPDFDDFVFRAVYHQCFCNVGTG